MHKKKKKKKKGKYRKKRKIEPMKLAIILPVVNQTQVPHDLVLNPDLAPRGKEELDCVVDPGPVEAAGGPPAEGAS